MPNPFIREHLLQQLHKTNVVYDVLVIGGGASGLGIALEAVTRGYKTLLLEQADFAKGTSSRSTKLVHGGVRYLAQGDVKLVREASIERAFLLKNAPHLAKDQLFLVPVYNWWEALKYTVGLKLYDWMAGSLSLGDSIFLGRKKTLQKLTAIKTKGLIGAVQYHDGQFDDARLALNLAQTIIEKGGLALNYIKVTNLPKNEDGKINGVAAKDELTGEIFQLPAKAVINATGVFVDAILEMDKPGSEKTISVSQGVHLVIDKKFYPSSEALMIPETSDGRVLFAVPWHDKVILGTTDTAVENPSLEPIALEKEIGFILKTAGTYLQTDLKRQDVLSVFAGLRPLAAPAKGKVKTKEISRSHKIKISPNNLFTMLGGKWTTYRKMGEDMIDKVEQHFTWEKTKSVTTKLPVHAHTEVTDWNDPLYFYGTYAADLQQRINADETGWVSIELRLHKAQIVWAAENEMAQTLEDILARRTRCLFLNAKETCRIAPAVTSILAEALGKDKNWESEQLQAFLLLAKNYMLN